MYVKRSVGLLIAPLGLRVHENWPPGPCRLGVCAAVEQLEN